MWGPLLIVTYVFEEYEEVYNLTTILSTVFMVTGAYGFRKLTKELSSGSLDK